MGNVGTPKIDGMFMDAGEEPQRVVALVARLKKFGLEGLIFFLRWHLAN